jgi:hypothetical protein
MEKDRSSNVDPVDWKRAIQTLISEGHDKDKIKNYTLNQVVLFYEAIMEDRVDKIKQDVTVQAMAMSGNSKQIKRFISDLDGKPPEMMQIVKED